MNQLLVGDCRDLLPTYPDNYFDSCVLDTPYELGIFGKAWDKTGIAYDVPTWQLVLRKMKPGAHLLAFGGSRTYHRIACAIEDAGFEIRDQIMWVYGSGLPKSKNLAHEWLGWGTALKPAHEPICVARKPLEKGLTVAANVLKWGTGALNVDGCRVSTTSAPAAGPAGRWPANLIHDGSEEVVSLLPETKNGGGNASAPARRSMFGERRPHIGATAYAGDAGSAARFFYCAKASTAERGEGNDHTCVKPQALLRYLARLVTPPGGRILDHFTGSGSGPLAFTAEGFNYVAMDLSQHNINIATRRLEKAAYALAL